MSEQEKDQETQNQSQDPPPQDPPDAPPELEDASFTLRDDFQHKEPQHRMEEGQQEDSSK